MVSIHVYLVCEASTPFIKILINKTMTMIRKKIWPDYFELVRSGKKIFELRVADFDIREDDIFVLEEWDPRTKEYTGRRLEKKVKNVFKFNLDDFGQRKQIEERGLYIIQI